jgi:transcription termination/antitermination protein NusG
MPLGGINIIRINEGEGTTVEGICLSAANGHGPSGAASSGPMHSEAGESGPRWYAAYTCANHEKRVAGQLGIREVEHFLPLYSSMRRWKDRRVKLDMPLFPGYVFVRMALRDRLQVQQVPGVARLVGFVGMPAALPDEEIGTLRASLSDGVWAEPYPFLTVGRRVRLKSGPLAGIEGVLLKRKGKLRVVISIDLIQRAVAVDVDAADLEAVSLPAAEPVTGRAAENFDGEFRHRIGSGR